jgi:small subunit ribosomal protein S17
MEERQTTQATVPPSAEAPAKHRRMTKVGRVVSDKMDKTVVVAVDNKRRHPLYNKTVTRTKKFHAHDAENECVIGDIVRIEESRPLSKMKRWVVRDIVERAARVQG